MQNNKKRKEESHIGLKSEGQFRLVYNILSFSLASLLASTMFFWMRVPAMSSKYQTALLISGLVTFIAAHHYMRFFSSWTEACYSCGPDGQPAGPHPTGVPFNDAYRYMSWMLAVPWLSMAIVLTMKLSQEESQTACTTLGVASALIIILGYPGELIVEADQLAIRWKCWTAATLPFLHLVFSLLIGLNAAGQAETRESVKELIFRAQWLTVVSWLTYLVGYILPMISFNGASSVSAIQVGYCVSDVISKCGVSSSTGSHPRSRPKIRRKVCFRSECMGELPPTSFVPRSRGVTALASPGAS